LNYKFSSRILKLTAVLLAAVCFGVCIFSGVNALVAVNWGFIGGTSTFQTSWRTAELVRDQGFQVIDQFRRNPDFQYWDRMLEGTNLRFIILEESTGEVRASYVEGLGIDAPRNLKDNIFLYQYDGVMSKGEYGTVLENLYVCDYYFGGNWSGENSWWQQEQQKQLEREHTLVLQSNHVQALIASGIPEDEALAEAQEAYPLEDAVGNTAGETYQILYLLGSHIDGYCGDDIGNYFRLYLYFQYQAEYAVAQVLISAALLLVCVVFLVVQAGRSPHSAELHMTRLDRIPTDLLLIVAAAAGIGLIGAVVALWEACDYNYRISLQELAWLQSVCAVGGAACGMVILAVLCSVSVRIKAGRFWQSALLFRGCRWCWRMCRGAVLWLWHQLVLGVRSVGMVPRAVLALLGVAFIEFLLLIWLINAWEPAWPLMALALFNVILLGIMVWGFAQMRILQKAAKALAEGNLDSQLDTGRMYWEFKQHGDHLNAIADGMNKAVEQRMKSERLKTELITNVSHDIKTPLTSIVNYVDLLQKPHSEAEQVQYLEVLDRQSKRLKKLTENLVEASKASTGNLPVELQPTSVLELLNQAVEEYRDRLEAGKLETVMDLRGDLMVQADGKHMWRILDNLLNNVVKYAMPGTRVYVTAQKRDRWVVIAVKNISRDPLNVDAEELMERFVRGDSSRTTEGSGLGLNIVRSLTVLQHGQFDLTVDGDFFKAELSLPAV